MIELFNLGYFIYILIAVAVFFLLFFILRKRTKKTQYITLLVILFCNLALHFLKLCFEPYRSGLPETIRKVTFENICAVSTLVFPFIFLTKKKSVLHDFMFFIGVFGGLGALLYPAEALGKEAITFDTIRFYLCHMSLCIVPLLSAIFNIHRPRLKNVWYIPLLFFVYEIVIFINEIILIKLNFVSSTLSEFFDRDIRNSSFIFGPLSSFDSLGFLFEPLVPSIFKSDFLGINNGTPFYFPILWMVFPVLIYFPIAYLIITSPFTIYDFVKSRKAKKLYTKKAGCIIVDVENKKIGMIYRKERNDFEFAKGHVENGESFEHCAVRETAEETKRDVEIVTSIKPYSFIYSTPSGEKCFCKIYVSIDKGKSDNDSPETHDLKWVELSEVEKTLSYENLKIMWNRLKPKIKKILKQKKHS